MNRKPKFSLLAWIYRHALNVWPIPSLLPKPRRFTRTVCPLCHRDFAVTKTGAWRRPHRCKSTGGAA